jgi:hypothetical protein
LLHIPTGFSESSVGRLHQSIGKVTWVLLDKQFALLEKNMTLYDLLSGRKWLVAGKYNPKSCRTTELAMVYIGVVVHKYHKMC